MQETHYPQAFPYSNSHCVLPVSCISEGDIYTIDASACIDCGSCAGVCPVDAPQPE